MVIDVELEDYLPSPVIRTCGIGYCRLSAYQFADRAARLTARQGVFYRNLIRIAERLNRLDIPVDFELSDGSKRYLDRGCIKIAELSGFIRRLRNDHTGVVSTIRLAMTDQ